MLTPLTTLLLASIVCGTVLAGLWLARRAPAPEQDLIAVLKSERLAMQADFAHALEQAVGIAEQVKKHRARIDGGSRGAPALPAAQVRLEELDPHQVAKLPVTDQLRWAANRTRRGA
jgi:CHAD domain-containing protein